MRIAQAARVAGRDPDEIRLVAVSKTFSASDILEAARAGLCCFGENRFQEAAKKIPEVREAIRVIRIKLGDEMTAAVGRAKIAKGKLGQQAEAERVAVSEEDMAP